MIPGMESLSKGMESLFTIEDNDIIKRNFTAC